MVFRSAHDVTIEKIVVVATSGVAMKMNLLSPRIMGDGGQPSMGLPTTTAYDSVDFFEHFQSLSPICTVRPNIYPGSYTRLR